MSMALPKRGSILYGRAFDHFLNISDEEIPGRMIELAKYYYYNHELIWFTWGTSKHIAGQYSPALQALVDEFNDMPVKNIWDITGYFVLLWSGTSWVVYYTPYIQKESIELQISEDEALLLANQFYINGFIYMNVYLNNEVDITPFIYH